jgi:hypothetical protein
MLYEVWHSGVTALATAGWNGYLAVGSLWVIYLTEKDCSDEIADWAEGISAILFVLIHLTLWPVFFLHGVILEFKDERW